jgi:hypothetical protein
MPVGVSAHRRGAYFASPCHPVPSGRRCRSSHRGSPSGCL